MSTNRQSVSEALDILSDTPGNILVRQAKYWEGQPFASAANIQALLDTITNQPALLLIRGATAWEAFDPYDPSNLSQILDVLTSTPGLSIRRGSSEWEAYDPGSGGSWIQDRIVNITTSAASQAITGIPAYNNLKVILRASAAASAGVRQLRVSDNNGTSYYNTIGDYSRINTDGTNTNLGAVPFFTGATTATRNGTIDISMFSLSGSLKTLNLVGSTSSEHRFVAATNPINALQITNSAGGNLNGGTCEIYGN